MPPMQRWLHLARRPMRVGQIPPLPPFPEITPFQKAVLFQNLTAEDLFDQISTPDIRGRLIQILHYLGDTGLPAQEFRSWVRDKTWDMRTAAEIVLTWFAWRFPPKSFLITGPIAREPLAAVALTSPRSSVVCFFDLGTHGRRASYHRRRFSQLCQDLARFGYQGRTDFREARLSEPVLAANEAFDLIFLDGSKSLGQGEPLIESIFCHCALGGLIVRQGTTSSASPNGWPTGAKSAFPPQVWEQLKRSQPDFRFLETPEDSRTGLAFRVAESRFQGRDMLDIQAVKREAL